MDHRYRRMARGTFFGGIVMTALIHGGLLALVFVQANQSPAPEAARDFLVTKMVTLGKPREKFWLPRIVQPPKAKAPEPTIKLSDNPNAAPAVKEAPRPDDPKVSKDLKHALDRARMLAQNNAPEEPPEGSLTGSTKGTSSEASVGDEYATKVFEAIRKNWNVPTGLSIGTAVNLEVDIRVSIGAGGELSGPRVTKSSGNELFDSSCVQAIEATRTVPPPPPGFRRGIVLTFDGKTLAR